MKYTKQFYMEMNWISLARWKIGSVKGRHEVCLNYPIFEMGEGVKVWMIRNLHMYFKTQSYQEFMNH